MSEKTLPPELPMVPLKVSGAHVRNIQHIIGRAGLASMAAVDPFFIEQVLLADRALAAVGLRQEVDLLSFKESAALLTHAEQTWSDLQANKLGGFSDGNRVFWLVHAFKQVIETFGRRDVGLHHSNDELRSMGL